MEMSASLFGGGGGGRTLRSKPRSETQNRVQGYGGYCRMIAVLASGKT